MIDNKPASVKRKIIRDAIRFCLKNGILLRKNNRDIYLIYVIELKVPAVLKWAYNLYRYYRVVFTFYKLNNII